MPRGKAATAAKKSKAPNSHKLAKQFPKGEVLQDLVKKRWVLGEVIGQGGFGLIYLASSGDDVRSGPTAEYVIKIEPIGNGPLFSEVHFYQRAAKADKIDAWLKEKKLKYLGVPKYISFGQHEFQKENYRFMVMQRFGTDIQKVFVQAGKSFSKQTVFALGLRMIDALEYLHESSYVHADIKASNCLLGHKNGKQEPDVVYLVDYGLACKYQIDGGHRELKEDPRKAHDGTIEFTSLDAHKGIAPSRRGDMEILGYCLLQWLCGTLPWEDKLGDPNYVRDSKIRAMSDIPALMKKCFSAGSIPDEIASYLTAVKNLKYDEKPNYNKLRDILSKGLTKLGVKDTWKLALPLSGKRPRSPSPKKPAKKTPVAVKKKPGRPATPKDTSRPSTPKAKPTPEAGTSSPIPGKAAKKTATKRTATAKASKPSTPAASAIVPGLSTGKSKNAAKKPGAKATARQARSPIPGAKATARQARSPIPGAKATARQARSPIPGAKATARQARSPIPGLTNGKRASSPAISPAPKKRKVARNRNAHLVEIACQTSPGLKKNR